MAALFLSGVAVAASVTAPDRWVTDGAGLLSPGIRDGLDHRLEAYQRRTGHQVIVWIGTTIGGESLEPWAARTFKDWGIGRKNKDDGVAIFVLAQDRRIRIEVGYGLEGQLTDLQAAGIIRDDTTPLLQQGNRDGALVATVNAVLGALGGEEAGANSAVPGPARGAPISKWELIVFAIAGVLLLGFLVTHPSMATFLLVTLASSARRGGRGGGMGGGGFSGGGGSSGGGGASGSW